MYVKKEYKTLRTVASVTAGFGWLVVAAFFILGFLAGANANGVIAGILLGAASGLLFGIGFIISGQLVSVFLDQKEILEEMLEQSRGKTPATGLTS